MITLLVVALVVVSVGGTVAAGLTYRAGWRQSIADRFNLVEGWASTTGDLRRAGVALEQASDDLRVLESEAERLRTDLGRALDALGFYANRDNWVSPSKGFALQYEPVMAPAAADEGARARNCILAMQAAGGEV